MSLAVPPPQAVIAAPSISCLAAVGARPPLKARFLGRFSYRRLARLNRARTCHEADAKALIRLARPSARAAYVSRAVCSRRKVNGTDYRPAPPTSARMARLEVGAMSPIKEENA